MQAKILDATLQDFDKIASDEGDNFKGPAEYVVDVFLTGAGNEPAFSGTMERPDVDANAVKMNLLQYGSGNDFGAIVVDCASIAAVRMRRPR